MRTHSHPGNAGQTHAVHDNPAQTHTERCSRNRWARIADGTSAPAPVMLVSIFFMLIAACGQQPSQDLLTQMNARFEQLEKRITMLEEQDVQLTEFANDAKATSIKLEEKMTEVAQQLEKMAARPSAPSVRKSAQPTSMPPGEKHHTVARGETLYSIAKRYRLSVDDLRRLNNLNPDQPILAGQKLAVSPNVQQ